MPGEKNLEKTDEEIILLYKNGQKEVFKTLIDRYTKVLYNFTARLVNRNDAPDIVSEIFIKVWKNINGFDPAKARFKTWLFTIARNTAIDFSRKKHSLLFSDIGKGGEEDVNSLADNIPDEQILPDAALQKLQDSEFLNKLLDRLPENYKTVLVLHYQEEMSFDEIGKILNKPLNTVKSQHYRALQKLREIIS